MWPRQPIIHNVTTSGVGTGFLVNHKGKQLIVTAAHVISSPRSPVSVTDAKTGKTFNKDSILTSRNRIRVSDLSFTPSRIAVDAANDLAILELHQDDLSVLDLQPLFLLQQSRSRTPEIVQPTTRQGVQIWGFPSSNQPQLVTNIVITAVERSFFVLNQPLQPGFSGGPVINADKVILGVVSRSTQNQTRCVNNSILINLLDNFEAIAKPYRDGQPPPF